MAAPASKAAAKQDATRARLLAAAAEVFAEKGFEEATVREICKKARANVALVNYYFGDKLELYMEILRGLLPPTRGACATDSLTPEETLREMIRVMLDRAMLGGDRSSLRYRLVLHEFMHPSPATAAIVDVTIRPVYDRLRELVGRILGLSPGHDVTRLCVHSLIAQVSHFAHGGAVLHALWPKLKMTPPQRDQVAGHIADLMLTYLASVRSRAARRPRQQRGLASPAGSEPARASRARVL